MNDDILIRWLRREDRLPFFDLFTRCGAENRCYCTAWYSQSWDAWDSAALQRNKQVRQDLFDRNVLDGVLAVREDIAVGWCQCIPRNSARLLTNMYGKAEPDGVAITCILIAPEFRKLGLSKMLIQAAVEGATAQGFRYLRCIPVGCTREAG